ncbi:hypothetical protein BGZ51_007184 [Haplosporangium sp. Z 767]|nr:hypothetical protein BGZ51_007184 [Haplosporangium sp. Z 767]
MSTLNLEGTFVEFLFERLLFEHILTQNSQTGCCIDPELMAVKLGLDLISGVGVYMMNRRSQYKIFQQV